MKYSRSVKVIISIFVAVFLFTISSDSYSKAEQVKQTDNKNTISLNNGKKWRIGFCESESYMDYASTFYYLIKGLEEKGVITETKDLAFKEGQDDTSEMWKWISSKDISKYVEFVPDAYYDLKVLNADNDSSVVDNMIKRLNEKKDIDLMIVMGTKAGLALANDKQSVPTLIFSTSDPIGAGIIKSQSDSGRDNVWAHVDKRQYQRQIEVFYDTFKFKKMGIVYENSDLVKNYISYNDIKEVAKEKNFQVVEKYVNEPKDDSDYDRYYKEIAEAYKQLSVDADAVLLTDSPIASKKLPDLLNPFYEKKIPIFSQSGSEDVKYGALMTITTYDFVNLKIFSADTIIKVLNGAKPRDLTQIFESTPNIILNLEVAKMCGYKPPIDILLVADKIYKKIEK